MMVTFVSQCEKNAIKKTRRVLDAFANRIGNNTWQTAITNDGLNAVKKLLRKNASKNTAVTCHWLRSRSRSELVWIVGNRNKFNAQGLVPVNITQTTIMNTQWENNWYYLPLIKALTALSALFHDWGKASACFQEKLQPKNSKQIIADPLRHEWISCLLLNALVHNQTDEAWLGQLLQGTINEEQLKNIVLEYTAKPLANLPDAASLIAWLVVSHHRLPLPLSKEDWRGELADSLHTILNSIEQTWGYENKYNESEYQKKLALCFTFTKGLLSHSSQWIKQLKKWAEKLQNCLPLVNKSLQDGCWRLVLYHSRLSLMLGDHYYSSQPADDHWQSTLELFANTDKKSGKQKQKLDEHLVSVAKNALHISHLLPAFENDLPVAQDIRTLKKKSPSTFSWQDSAVEKIKKWRHKLPESTSITQQGFFAVNMASTGCGKTIANAKIMRVLSIDSNSLRFVLALGLRTLTLQTGDEYRNRIGLDNTELAILIGTKSIMELHHLNKESIQEEDAQKNEEIGSESLESLLDEAIDYECDIPVDRLTTVLTNERDKKFLYAPVLVCTIDHIISATETIRGGRYILPSLRLMSSDLVIDEVDDFDGKDLIAIGRLIHLAGMLGRKVMISSATIPPNLAEGYFNTYREGWMLYSKTRGVTAKIGCAWIDEFTTQVETVTQSETSNALSFYKNFHNNFVAKRVEQLKNKKKTPIRRKGEIIPCDDIYSSFKRENQTILNSLEKNYFYKIQHAIIDKCKNHYTIDSKTSKKVSFGVVRIANISPCIALSEYLIQSDWPENIDAKIMIYHSQQVLLLRSEQEKHLDCVLQRKEKKDKQPNAFSDPVIRDHLDKAHAENVIFILVATPIEEVGRDHDFDWAIIEPSSFRSIIQLAGRVMRHRQLNVHHANIGLMQYNLKSLTQDIKRPSYCNPGYEQSESKNNGEFKLKSHDLKILLEGTHIENNINACPRILFREPLQPTIKLADLEHYSISYFLTRYEQCGPEAMQGWLTQCWWLTAIPQVLNRFRESVQQTKLYLIWKDGTSKFIEKDENGNTKDVEQFYNIKKLSIQSSNRLWLERDYVRLLKKKSEQLGMTMYNVSIKYGEISIPYQENDIQQGYVYSDQFGLNKKK